MFLTSKRGPLWVKSTSSEFWAACFDVVFFVGDALRLLVGEAEDWRFLVGDTFLVVFVGELERLAVFVGEVERFDEAVAARFVDGALLAVTCFLVFDGADFF